LEVYALNHLIPNSTLLFQHKQVHSQDLQSEPVPEILSPD